MSYDPPLLTANRAPQEQINAYSFGSSYSTTGTAVPWIQRINVRLPLKARNDYAAAGSHMNDAYARLLNVGVATGSLYAPGMMTIDAGVNEIVSSNTTPVRKDGIKNAYAQGLRAWLRMCQSSAAVESGSMTRTGTWTANTGESSSFGGTSHSTVTQNDYIEHTVTVGSTGTITLYLKTSDPFTAATASAAYQIRANGVLVASGTTVGVGGEAYPMAAQTPANYCVCPVVVTGLTPGSNTIRVTKTDASGSILYVDRLLVQGTTVPTCLVMIDPYTTGYPDALTDEMRAVSLSVLAEFTQVPNAIAVCDPIIHGWDKASMILADTVHPNDKGANLMAAVSIQALRGCGYRLGQNAA